LSRRSKELSLWINSAGAASPNVTFIRAIQVTKLDGPAAMELVDIDEPPASDRMVIVDVEAAGVSFPDVLLSRGLLLQNFRNETARPVAQSSALLPTGWGPPPGRHPRSHVDEARPDQAVRRSCAG